MGANSTASMRLLEQEPEHGEGNEGEEQVEREALRGCGVQTAHGVPQPHAILPAHRQDRGALDDDQVAVDRLALEAEQRTRQYQVPGAGDRQEFRDALDEARA